MELEQLLAVPSMRASGAEAVAGDRTVETISSHKAGRTMDLFLVSSRLRRVVGTPEVLAGTLCLPHRPVRLFTMARPRCTWCRSSASCRRCRFPCRSVQAHHQRRAKAPLRPLIVGFRVVCHPSHQAGPRKAALQGLSIAYDEWVGHGGALFSITGMETRCTGRGRQACLRKTRVVTRGQSRWAGSTLTSMPYRWAANMAKEIRSALLHCAEVHPRICALPTSETSSVSLDAPAVSTGLDTRHSRVRFLAQSVIDLHGGFSPFSSTQHIDWVVWHKKFSVAALLALKAVDVVLMDVVKVACQVCHDIAALASAIPHAVEGMDCQCGGRRSQAGPLVDKRNCRVGSTGCHGRGRVAVLRTSRRSAPAPQATRMDHHVDSGAPLRSLPSPLSKSAPRRALSKRSRLSPISSIPAISVCCRTKHSECCASCCAQLGHWAMCRAPRGRSSWPCSASPLRVQAHRVVSRAVCASALRLCVAKQQGRPSSSRALAAG